MWVSKDVRLSPPPPAHQVHASPQEVQDYACTLLDLDSQTSVADTTCLS